MRWTDCVGMGSDRTRGLGYRSTYLPYYQRLVDRVDRVERQAPTCTRATFDVPKIEIERASLGNGIRNGNGKREFGAKES